MGIPISLSWNDLTFASRRDATEDMQERGRLSMGGDFTTSLTLRVFILTR